MSQRGFGGSAPKFTEERRGRAGPSFSDIRQREGQERPKRPAFTPKEEDFEPATVKFVSGAGYGFLERDSGDEDVYFHLDRVDAKFQHLMVKGARLEVAATPGRKGPVAAGIRFR